ncbi:hypothetical protein HMN09_00016300 [Mycena chlorophos]|uniref:Uncharacterized protein n=1 Tax=Mycena chlorophos TaxID=658473 RepID=A0A8H6TSP7_MYCCL|nr:hypothetical protein HMN09_00016300 [Mycena chlorophos]
MITAKTRPGQVHGTYVAPLRKITLAWILALVFAVGHHAFYHSLNGRPVEATASLQFRPHSQPGASAIGTALAWLASFSLALSAGTAFLQLAWRSVQQRSWTVSGLDALWSSPNDIMAFLEADFWRSGRATVLVVAAAWAFPLVTTFAPGTLSVSTVTITRNQTCPVPTFDFGTNALFEVTPSVSLPYERPSSLALRTIEATLFSGNSYVPASICSGNCSYTMSVAAPSFECTSGLQNATALNWTDQGPGLTPPPFAGGNFDASPSRNDYHNWDLEVLFANYVEWFPEQAGIGHSTNVSCIAYNSTYYLNYTFAGPLWSINIDNLVRGQPASQMASSTENSNAGSGPLTHTQFWNATTNYHALLSTITSYLVGNIEVFQSTSAVDFDYTPPALVAATELLADTTASNLPGGNLTWNASMITTLETLVSNTVFSVLTLDPAQTTDGLCSFSDNSPRFSYNARRLWLIYGLGLGLALVVDVIGVTALWRNGFGAGGDFRDMLVSTRNSGLDGPETVKEIQDGSLRLRFGRLRKTNGGYAFAEPDSLVREGEEDVGMSDDEGKGFVGTAESSA